MIFIAFCARKVYSKERNKKGIAIENDKKKKEERRKKDHETSKTYARM